MEFIILLVFFIVCISSPMATPNIEKKDFKNLFKDYVGTIVIYNETSNRYFVHNIDRSRTRFTPFSTFKIANSIVALETGIIGSVDSVFQWDAKKYPKEKWWPEQWHGPHTMRSAIQFSVVPFYREIAFRIGPTQMQAYVNKFNYGNKDISSGHDSFWLNGNLSISAMEQIDFLRKFYNNKFDISKKTIEAVKDILLQEDNTEFKLSAKTGAGTGFDKENPEKALGWYVGYVEKGKTVIFFAMNIEGESFNEILSPRIDITKGALQSVKIIE